MGSVSNISAYISTLAAERRWVMTGTPITGAVSGESLVQLHHLLSFLRHPTYGRDSSKEFLNQIVTPFLQGDQEAFDKVVALLVPIFIRHMKKDLCLFDPIYSIINLRPKKNPFKRVGGDLTDRIDYSMASYIAEVVSTAKQEWKTAGRQCSERRRRPKAIVFAKNHHLLSGVATCLYYILGDSDVCEHYGEYRSCELSRFRQSRARYCIKD